jgi:hypothetical protein
MSNPGVIGRSTESEPAELPPDRAFVVEFRGRNTMGGDESLCGRVEHVVSGRAAHFESAAELLDFIRGVLRACAQTPD